MDPSLVNELAARLGTSTMEARIALADLLQDAREELEDHGVARLPGLGTFRHEGRAPSRLAFQPEALLADAVNHAFAGLYAFTVPNPSADAEALEKAPTAAPKSAEPEPLSENTGAPPTIEAPSEPSAETASAETAAEPEPAEPEPAEPEPAEPEPAEPAADTPNEQFSTETAPAAPTHDVPSADASSTDVPGTDVPGTDVPGTDEVLPNAADGYEADVAPEPASPEKIPGPDANSAPGKPEPLPRPALETPAPLPIRKVDWESVLQDTPYAVMPAAGYLRGGPTRAALEAATLEAPPAQPPAAHVPDHPPATRSSTRRRSPRRPWIAAAALVLVALAAAGLWYVMQPDEAPPSPPTAEEQPAPVTSPSPNIAAGAASTPDTAAAPSAEEEPATEEPAEEPLAPVLDPVPGNWTAVAASRPTRAEADVLARQYRVQLGAAGAPVGVIAGEVDGNQFFRVAVGRFGSFEETQTFLQRTDSPLPGDAWALQIEP